MYRWGVALALLLGCLWASPALAGQGPVVKMQVAETGLYRVTGAALTWKGIDITALDPARFQVTHDEVELAIRVTGAAAGVFGPDDAIEFYGTGIDRADPRHAHTDTDVYWLWLGGWSGTPARMETVPSGTSSLISNYSSYTKVLHMEEDTIYTPALPLAEGADRWMWDDRLQAGKSAPFLFRMTDHAGGPVSVRVRLQGATNDLAANPDHSVVTALNGCPLFSGIWDGFLAKNFANATSNPACVKAGDNTLTLTNEAMDGVSVNSVLVDWFEVTYERGLVAEFAPGNTLGLLPFSLSGTGVADFVLEGFGTRDVELYDVTDPTRVRQVLAREVVGGSRFGVDRFEDDLGAAGGKHYLAVGTGLRWQPVLEVDLPSTLSSPQNEARYVLITHPSMRAEAEQLANHRAGAGLSVKVVSTTDIYDEFAGGVTDPAAIRAFLAHAFATWAVPPEYVLLFGDAAPNFKTTYAWNGPSYVPTHLFTTQEGGVAPDDTWFVSFGTDPLPDMLIGRLPVTPQTAGGVVAKVIAYETQDDTSWTNRVQFAASWVDGSTVFEDHVGQMAATLPAEYAVDQLLIGELGADVVREDLLANLDDGRLLTVFSGHGGGTQWANEQILRSDDADALSNNPRLSFLLGFNCATGYFVEPFWQVANGLSLGEAVVLSPTGGAIGAWMAGWKGYASDQKVLGARFMDAFLAGGADGSRSQGAITTQTFITTIADGVEPRSVRAFNLLGDPATPLYDGTQAPPPPPVENGTGAPAAGGGCSATGTAAGWGDAAVLLLLLLGALLRAGWRRRG